MKVFSVVGARPQFIKAAPLNKALRTRHDEFLVHTGQHYDDEMSAVFFRQLGIPRPDINLGVGPGSHAEHLASMVVPLERLMRDHAPDWVLVYGDTNSTLAAALAAVKLNLRVAHIEAGLRSFNRTMPEEVNRRLTDHISDLLFCPTTVAVENLAGEGITEGVVLTGDIMVDAVMCNIATARRETNIHAQLGLSPTNPYAVVTIHRLSNADIPEALTEIIAALNALTMPVVFPIHPRTRQTLQSIRLSPADHMHLTAPIGYLEMLALLDAAAVLITDSGGLQKEAYVLKTPCVTVRTETEWVETVESGWNRLAAAERSALGEAVRAMLGATPARHPDFYGDGRAAERIVEALEANCERPG